MVKICSLTVDGPGPAQLPRESTGGGGYSRAVPAGVSPINTRQNKKPRLKKSRKNKKEPFHHSENLPKDKKAEIKLIEAPLRHNNKTK